MLDAELVRSSIARRLGIDIGGLKPADRNVEGVVEMMLDATHHYDQPLTAERLFGWHASLVPHRAQRHAPDPRWAPGVTTRTGPMQVVSGPVGHERVHFEAPAAAAARRAKCAPFWSGSTRDAAGSMPVLKAALAHLWFVTIHPFDDGNGRIARAIADMALARSEDSPQRFYSMSAQIRRSDPDYYDILEHTQKGTLDITPWMEWFLDCLGRAIDGAQTTLAAVLAKARFWEAHSGCVPLNDRQRLVLNRLLDGFEGKLTTSKWATAREVLAGHSAARHPGARRARDPRPQPGRRPEHQLRVGGAAHGRPLTNRHLIILSARARLSLASA